MPPSERFFLVELTAAIVRKRALFCIALFFALVVGGTYQWFAQPVYKFVTLVEVAKDGEGSLLQPGDAVLSSVDNEWLPGVRAGFSREWGHTPDFELKPSVIEGGYILFVSFGEAQSSEKIRWLHSAVATKMTDRQSELERRARAKFESQIDLAEQGLESLKATNNSTSSGADLFATLISLKGKAAGMRSAEVLVLAQQKDEELGLALSVRLGLVVMFALIFAAMSVLAYYFCRQVTDLVKGGQNL